MRLNKKITIIAAMARNHAIGLDGQMPWHLPGELRHFKETTMGKPIVMGRKTWQSIGRPLPGRQNIIVTRSATFQAPGCDVAGSLDRALELAEGAEVMIIGGGQLYQQALAFADRMILTVVDCEPEADTWFPEWVKKEWRQTGLRRETADDRNPDAYQVVEWVRKTGVCDISREPGKPAGPRA
jgi:dihydrofolate reductase